MSTQPITSANSTAANSTADKTKTDQMGSGLGQDAFLKLLVTQLQHQDPLQPQDDSQFLAQLATFSSLEQLTQMNASIQQLVTLAGGSSSSSTSNNNSSNNNSNSTNGTGS